MLMQILCHLVAIEVEALDTAGHHPLGERHRDVAK